MCDDITHNYTFILCQLGLTVAPISNALSNRYSPPTKVCVQIFRNCCAVTLCHML